MVRGGSILNSSSKYVNVISVLVTLINILEASPVSSAYLESAEKKGVSLINECERHFSGSYKNLQKKREEILSQKNHLLSLINEKYMDTTMDGLKIKYRFISNVVTFMGIYSDEQLKLVLSVRDKIVISIKTEMRSWLLSDKTKNIGLYGSGPQSNITINLYERLIGKVSSRSFYIDTDKESYTTKLFNRDIVNINDINVENPDQIIVCSGLYGNQMVNAVSENYHGLSIKFLYKDGTGTFKGVFDHNFIEILLKLRDSYGRKRLILICTPEYPNVGDHLIACAEYEYFKDYFKDYDIIEITNEDYAFFKVRIERYISPDDILIITGGGFFGTLWRDYHYDDVLDIFKRFRCNKIIAFPQSIYFSDDSTGDKYRHLTKDAMNSAVTYVICREKFSYETLHKLGISKNKTAIFPDIAFYYDQLKKNDVNKDETVGLYIREDKESVLQLYEKEEIVGAVEKNGYKVVTSSMQYKIAPIHKECRDLVVIEKLNEIRRHSIVITDQLHCMISCYLVGTKCIAINSISKKLEGVYEWIKDDPSILLVHSIGELKQSIESIKGMSIPDNKSALMKECWDEMYRCIFDFIERKKERE